jgi:hypothetical protein
VSVETITGTERCFSLFDLKGYRTGGSLNDSALPPTRASWNNAVRLFGPRAGNYFCSFSDRKGLREYIVHG